MTGDAVDHGVGGRETRRDPVVAGLAQHDPGDRRPLPVDPADSPEGEAAAGRVVRAGLDADEPVVPEQYVGVVDGAGDRQRRARCGDDARERRQAHGPIDNSHLVGGSRHGCVVVAARVGVAGVGHTQRPCGGIHPGNKPVRRAGIPARQDRGDVVRRRDQHCLQRLQFGQLLAGGDRHNGLVVSCPAVGVGDIGVGERDRRTVLSDLERVVTEHQVGRHHLRDARDRSRVLVRAGLDLRLSYLDRGLAICRPRGARQCLAKRAVVLTRKPVGGWCCRQGRGRQQLMAEDRGDRRDDDQKAADKNPGNPTGRRSRWFAVGHASSLGGVVLPARMRFSIRRRNTPARSIWSVRVLLVEDELYMAEAIRDGLRLEAISADIAGYGDSALELLGVYSYDIAVLDRDIPGPSGDEIAERIVASGSGTPILMLTAADRLDDKTSGFGLGADDYLTKPFELQELVLRLRALDRRRAHNRPPVQEIAGLRLDPFRRELYRDGRYVALTRKQFGVLEVLVAAEGGVVSAEALLERAWDENADPFTNAVRSTVSALRKRLGEPGIIATVAGVGYRIDTQPDTRA